MIFCRISRSNRRTEPWCWLALKGHRRKDIMLQQIEHQSKVDTFGIVLSTCHQCMYLDSSGWNPQEWRMCLHLLSTLVTTSTHCYTQRGWRGEEMDTGSRSESLLHRQFTPDHPNSQHDTVKNVKRIMTKLCLVD